MKIRPEDFGAIVATDDPPALLFVDRALATELGLPHQERWDNPRGHLSAPTEVHLLLTRRCDAGCPRCYVNATPDGAQQPREEVFAWLSALAAQGVFHVALGGGESMLRDDLFAIADHARSVGLVPNLTTSGLGMTAELAAECRRFGQVNLSLDGLGETYRNSRGYDGAAIALHALDLLVAAGVPTGINFVVSRHTIGDLEATTAEVARRGGNEVELLRLKPTGRAGVSYPHDRLLPEQAASLLPRVVALIEQHPTVKMKVDCSFVPLLCATGPNPDTLAALGVVGCEAGNVLAAVSPEGSATACSFINDRLGSVAALTERWDDHPVLDRWRNFHTTAPEPCASCPYRLVCKGGCKAVSKFYHHGDPFHPDPECPRVVAHREGRPFVSTPITLPAHV